MLIQETPVETPGERLQETPAESPGERIQETHDERPREEPIDPLMFRYFLFETNLTLNTKQAGRGGHLASPPFFWL